MTGCGLNTAPRIVFGDWAIARIGEIAAAQLGCRVMLVTDPGLLKVGLIQPALHALQAAGVAVALLSDLVASPPEPVANRPQRRRTSRRTIQGRQ
jgi:alcohol dehydrogenase class IV